jgi:hypothetical protein
VRALMRNVEVRESKSGLEEIELVFADGSRARETVRIARGHPQNPLSDEQRLSKVKLCLEPRLGAARSRQAIAAFDALESVKDVRELAGCLA